MAVKAGCREPLLETTIAGATDIIINVSGDISMFDASDAVDYVREITGDDVNIIFGAMYDSNQADYCRITVIATGIDAHANTGEQGLAVVPLPKMPSSLNLNRPSMLPTVLRPARTTRPYNSTRGTPGSSGCFQCFRLSGSRQA